MFYSHHFAFSSVRKFIVCYFTIAIAWGNLWPRDSETARWIWGYLDIWITCGNCKINTRLYDKKWFYSKNNFHLFLVVWERIWRHFVWHHLFLTKHFVFRVNNSFCKTKRNQRLSNVRIMSACVYSILVYQTSKPTYLIQVFVHEQV